MAEAVRVHLLISGIVQGVFFRANTETVARSLGLKGRVRNLIDGRVEVIAEGQRDKISEFVDWCHQGPPAASVDKVEVMWERATGEFKTFKTDYSR